MRLIFSALLVCCSLLAAAQPPANTAASTDLSRYQYDTDRLTPAFHAGRREALRKLMPDSSVAVFFASPERNRSNDVDFQYHQDPDFYYLTGYEEPNAMLLVFKEKQNFDSLFTDEIIFVQDRAPEEEVWTGRRLGVSGGKQALGIASVKSDKSFSSGSFDFSKLHKVLYYTLPTDVRDDKDNPGDLYSLLKHFRSKTEKNANNDTYWLDQYMKSLRQIKQPEELVLLRKAIKMSCDGHNELMRALTPGMTEYQAQAVVEFVFKQKGSEYPGYPSIVGAGENSCILHYESNRRPTVSKDIMVCDAGAEYHGYSADVTRTLPVNGKFSEEQKKIYNIVLEAQEAGIKACRKGNAFRDPHVAAQAVITKRLKELGIITKDDDVDLYFFHGTSHYLGLDVHDAGLYGRLATGNVITVEPGIYIAEGSACDKKWWNIGVRIEDDVLITDGDPDVLSKDSPKTVEEIEKLMKETSPLTPAATGN